MPKTRVSVTWVLRCCWKSVVSGSHPLHCLSLHCKSEFLRVWFDQTLRADLVSSFSAQISQILPAASVTVYLQIYLPPASVIHRTLPITTRASTLSILSSLAWHNCCLPVLAGAWWDLRWYVPRQDRCLHPWASRQSSGTAVTCLDVAGRDTLQLLVSPFVSTKRSKTALVLVLWDQASRTHLPFAASINFHLQWKLQL